MSHACNPYNIISSIDPHLSYLFLVGKHCLGCHVFVEQGQRIHTDPGERVGPSQPWLTRPVSSVAYQLGKPHILLLVSQNHPFPMSKQQGNSHCRRGMKLFPAGDLRQQRISSLTGAAIILSKLCCRWCQCIEKCHRIHVMADVANPRISSRICKKHNSPFTPQQIVQIGRPPIHLTRKVCNVKFRIKLDARQIVKISNIMVIYSL